MRHQPTQSAKSEQPTRDSSTAPKGTKHTAALAGAALLAFPFQSEGIAALPSDTGPVFTAILAVLVTVLGISASILYRHMHHREEESRRRAENAEAELRALLLITDDAVLLLSSDGNVRAANPAAEELFGRDADNFVGEPLTDLITQPLALGELTKNGPVNFETRAKRGSIDSAPVEMLLSPVELSGGKAFLAIIHEPREAAAAEPVKEPAKDVAGTPKLRDAVGKFTHDLNNQLTSLLGNLSLTLMARPGDPGTNERVLNAKKTAVRAQVLNQELQSLLNSSAEPKPAKPAQPTDEMSCTILPMPANAPAPTRMEAAPKPPRILILDDEEAICMLVSNILESSGYEVCSALSVAEAMHACEKAVKSSDPFSLVICDLSLPEDIDGLQALKQLRTIDPNLKAVVSSGYDSDPIMRDCTNYGFSAAMAKPYDVNRLIRTIGNVVPADRGLLKTA